MPYGRGGAGNIEAVSAENAKASADLEANQAAAETNHKGLSNYIDREGQQYAHTGRGGMGNYYSPRELSHTGRFEGAASSHIAGDGTPAPAGSDSGATSNGVPAGVNAAGSEAMKKVGRGGAGNFSFGMSQDEERAARKRMEDERKREQLKADVEKGVKETLAEPPKAKLAGGEPFEGPG